MIVMRDLNVRVGDNTMGGVISAYGMAAMIERGGGT